ncbi:saccharopine dehydrogenase NADP-binding domain-containing protein [Paeniglutamicibacter antarcticus]|uniref:Saccharopine dehydrogenase NADP-binding domain-containing protein n=1 Tax=Arthrobacter terrae TaxID=2935737 RepID=A0A931CSK7_9MICC|nr:saccharopine dehydrogenase NADP-binding domain-containing protein [Arthrobacter terrae]MBG0740131.1 saccharopine dehydrogenase NADP-binding domain-containing protein [Arthrobacter terrae]
MLHSVSVIGGDIPADAADAADGRGTHILMVYGCGSAGTRTAGHALKSGLDPVLGGRDRGKTAAEATSLGVPWRSAQLTDPAGVDILLKGVDILINTAGPFTGTAGPLMRACLRNRCHYLDLSNEIAVFRDAWILASAAREAGISIIPGAGAGTAAAEALAAHVLTKILTPDSLVIVRSSGTGVRTLGVRKTTMDLLSAGGIRYRNGEEEKFNKISAFDLPEGRRTAVPVASGDLFATAHSTGVPHVSAYFTTGMHRLAAKAAVPVMRRLINTGLVRASAPHQPAAAPLQPGKEPAVVSTQIWVQATDHSGAKVTSYLQAGRGADLSAVTAVEAARRIRPGTNPGVFTAGEILGPGYVPGLPGVHITDL